MVTLGHFLCSLDVFWTSRGRSKDVHMVITSNKPFSGKTKGVSFSASPE